jgi:hypothetical protein
MPLLDTVAAAVFSDDHWAALVRSSVAPVDSVTVAVNCAVPPAVVISVGPVTRTAVTVAVVVVVVGVGEVTLTVRLSEPPEHPTIANTMPKPRADAPAMILRADRPAILPLA